MQPLRNYVDQPTHSTNSDADFELITSELRPGHFPIGHFLLQAREICKPQAFVVEGALRLYTVNARGHKQTHALTVADMWIGDYESWLQVMALRYFIEALEYSQLMLLLFFGKQTGPIAFINPSIEQVSVLVLKESPTPSQWWPTVPL